MIRTTALLLGICSLAAGQGSEPQRTFWRQMVSLSVRQAHGEIIDVNSKVKEELGFSPDSAQAMLTTLREFGAGAEMLRRQLSLAVFERRLQVAAEEEITIAPEAELVAAIDRLEDALIARKMQELKVRLGEQEFQSLMKFIEDGRLKELFTVRAEVKR